MIRARRRTDDIVHSEHPLTSATLNGTEAITRPHLHRVLGAVEVVEDGDTDHEDSIHDETVVLVHKVSTGDSLAGVALRYGISMTDLRRANHLWTSDSIHLRTVLYIPLDKSTARDDAGSIKRIPTSELSYFPPSTNPMPSNNFNTIPARPHDIHTATATAPRTLSSFLSTLPIARLSFDSVSNTSTSSEQEHELEDVHPLSTPKSRGRIPNPWMLKPRSSSSSSSSSPPQSKLLTHSRTHSTVPITLLPLGKSNSTGSENGSTRVLAEWAHVDEEIVPATVLGGSIDEEFKVARGQFGWWVRWASASTRLLLANACRALYVPCHTEDRSASGWPTSVSLPPSSAGDIINHLISHMSSGVCCQEASCERTSLFSSPHSASVKPLSRLWTRAGCKLDGSRVVIDLSNLYRLRLTTTSCPLRRPRNIGHETRSESRNFLIGGDWGQSPHRKSSVIDARGVKFGTEALHLSRLFCGYVCLQETSLTVCITSNDYPKMNCV